LFWSTTPVDKEPQKESVTYDSLGTDSSTFPVRTGEVEVMHITTSDIEVPQLFK
jgi:hypothetical protein